MSLSNTELKTTISVKPLVLYLDAGHGGIDQQGIYTTAPGKMFTHNTGTFHRGRTFYEGVSNRVFADKIYQKLTELGFKVVKTYHPYLDYSLSVRCDIANKGHQKEPGIFISMHSNATPGDQRGIQYWTSVGQTKADVIATQLYNHMSKALSGYQHHANKIKTLTELKPDNDIDYEKNFTVLADTIMPAVLIENLFFDDYTDATILMDPVYQELFTTAIAQILGKILLNNNINATTLTNQ